MIDFSLFEKGGVVMAILAMLSIYALGIILFKAYQFLTAGIDRNHFIDQALREVRAGNVQKAQRTLGSVKGPIARIMRVAMDCVSNRKMSQRSREAEIARVGTADIQYLESHLRGLELTANIAPLLGLLGTVIGMVTAFSKLETAGTRVDPSLLAGGIWEALLTTVGGLIVAIPAVAAYYLFDSLIERVRVNMKDVTVQILALEDMFNETEIEEQKKQQESRILKFKEEVAGQRKLVEQHRTQIDSKIKAGEDKLREEEDRLRHEEERLMQMEERLKKEAENQRTTAQSVNTLRLLNPRYNHM